MDRLRALRRLPAVGVRAHRELRRGHRWRRRRRVQLPPARRRRPHPAHAQYRLRVLCALDLRRAGATVLALWPGEGGRVAAPPPAAAAATFRAVGAGRGAGSERYTRAGERGRAQGVRGRRPHVLGLLPHRRLLDRLEGAPLAHLPAGPARLPLHAPPGRRRLPGRAVAALAAAPMTDPAAREAERVRAAYARRARLGLDARYDYWQPANLFIYQSREREFVRLLRDLGRLPLGECRVLDVGCGDGGVLRDLVRLGARPSRLAGVDLLPDRIERARELIAGAAFVMADAQRLPF